VTGISAVLGCCGWLPVTACYFVPRLCVQLYKAAVVDRDFDRALDSHNRVAQLSDFILTHRLAACVKPGAGHDGYQSGGSAAARHADRSGSAGGTKGPAH
jgi:dihydrodipicolinate synthase/N-acetylneuraminate lyase